MCYNLKQKYISALKRARRNKSEEDIVYFAQKILEEQQRENESESYHQVSGFLHPKLIAYTNEKPFEPRLLNWGLIPHWVKTEKDAKNICNKTINARGETIFEKPSFRDSAKYKRCVIPIDGFYEHHHFNGNKYPYYVCHKQTEPLNLAGLWSEWTNKDTGEVINSCSIITTKANLLMAKIHNNPKLSEARMPVIFPECKEDEWLNLTDPKKLKQLMIPFNDAELKAHTVQKLSGKDALGDVAEASDEFNYFLL